MTRRPKRLNNLDANILDLQYSWRKYTNIGAIYNIYSAAIFHQHSVVTFLRRLLSGKIERFMKKFPLIHHGHLLDHVI